MLEILTESSKKVAKMYVCEKCNYSTPRKYNYNKHLQTKKHNTDQYLPNTDPKVVYNCICGKIYKHKQSLYHHKKTCKIYINTALTIPDKNVQNEIMSKLESSKYSSDKQNIFNITVNNTTNNTVEHIQNKANNIQTNNTNNNNTFSVKNYLNNECKDAFTVKQVLDNFHCDIMKLPSQPIPFYKDIVDKAFHNIPVEKLPIRCSDVKRNKFYGHTNEWEKDFDIVKEFIRKLVDTICEFRNVFVKKNPEWIENDITSELLSSIIINISKVYDEQTVNKIIRYISERTKINK
tara:strand:- start:56163 stop:57038 length:876 start_codon:yes stop_codon:yes gene_type:complete